MPVAQEKGVGTPSDASLKHASVSETEDPDVGKTEEERKILVCSLTAFVQDCYIHVDFGQETDVKDRTVTSSEKLIFG